MKITDDCNILFIGAHPDDIEFGCGAIISSLKNKSRLYCLTLTNMQKTVLNYKELVKQHYKSMNFLNIPKNNIILEDFEEREFHRDRQLICDKLYKIYKDINPSIVFCHPVYSDLHQDHEVVSKETLRIFRETTIFGYQNQPRYYYEYCPNVFYEVTEKDVNNKIKALWMYKVYKHKNYFQPELIYSQLKSNGVVIGTNFAEAFYTSKLAIKR